MIITLILGFTIVAGIEAPGLIRKKHWWELTVFCVLLGTGFLLSLLLAMGVELPPISMVINQFIMKLFDIKPE